MLNRIYASGVIAVVFGVAYLAMTMQIRVSALSDGFGPRGMPLVYGWLMTGLGLILVLQSLSQTMKMSPEDRAAHQKKEWRGMSEQIIRAAGLLAIAVGYVVIVPILGYALSLILVIVAVALYMGATPSLRLALISIGGAVLMWIIFVGLLDVRMPQGVFSTLFS
ncbi:tripartite tricarboxylate transporter TctB family protein [Thioclava sp. FR2]|uniref:tripartite tricarboxylate transporter TctB family protein n=1 Tax=Thioclava sp. FR2 TaxID=3445780 RepID=UPI003EB793BD